MANKTKTPLILIALVALMMLAGANAFGCNDARPGVYVVYADCGNSCFGYYPQYDCVSLPYSRFCCVFCSTTEVDCGGFTCYTPVLVAVYCGGYCT